MCQVATIMEAALRMSWNMEIIYIHNSLHFPLWQK